MSHVLASAHRSGSGIQSGYPAPFSIFSRSFKFIARLFSTHAGRGRLFKAHALTSGAKQQIMARFLRHRSQLEACSVYLEILGASMQDAFVHLEKMHVAIQRQRLACESQLRQGQIMQTLVERNRSMKVLGTKVERLKLSFLEICMRNEIDALLRVIAACQESCQKVLVWLSQSVLTRRPLRRRRVVDMQCTQTLEHIKQTVQGLKAQMGLSQFEGAHGTMMRALFKGTLKAFDPDVAKRIQGGFTYLEQMAIVTTKLLNAIQ